MSQARQESKGPQLEQGVRARQRLRRVLQRHLHLLELHHDHVLGVQSLHGRRELDLLAVHEVVPGAVR